MASINENGLCYAEQENIKRMKENMPYIICGDTEDEKFECCPYYQDQFDTCMSDGSQQKALKMAVDLINRQNVEIERLEILSKEFPFAFLRKFTERLKGDITYKWTYNLAHFDDTNKALQDIDKLTKEMIGETK